MVQAVEAQLEKLQLKMKQFEEFETVMNLQRQQVDRDRVALYQTRLALNAKRANANSNAVPTISSSQAVGLAVPFAHPPVHAALPQVVATQPQMN